jgi:hypothetical protein
MHERRTKRTRIQMRGRAALLGAAVAFALLQFLAALVADCWQPRFRDPEYGRRLIYLRHDLQENPGRPLAIVMGSSRVGAAIRPDVLMTASSSGGRTPLVFNYCMVGSGPIMQLCLLERLLADGIRPDLVCVECWAPFFRQDEVYGDHTRIDVQRLSFQDLSLLRHYWMHPKTLCWNCLKAHLIPWYSHRFPIMGELAPGWLPHYYPCQENEWYTYDHFGWVRLKDAVDYVEYRCGVDGVNARFRPYLGDFRLSEKCDRGVRELITRCRRQRIKVVLLNLPEGREFQAWYPPRVAEQWLCYCRKLSQECGVPFVDARPWMPDNEFLDGIHLMPHGARHFTLKLAEEVIFPLLATDSETAQITGKR